MTPLLLWLLCSAAGYALVRLSTHLDGSGWTLGDRAAVAGLSLLFGPASLLFSLALLVMTLADRTDWSRPASW